MNDNPIITELSSVAAKVEKVEAEAIAALSIARIGQSISIINASTVVTDAEAEKATAAVQIQIERDFLPAWGLSAKLVFVPKGGSPDPAHWPMEIGDTSDQLNALGWHDIGSSGQPLGKVFAKSDLDAGTSWTVTLSHEVCEIIVDPWLVVCAFIEDSQGGTLYAFETADACESDSLGYLINGVLVSDFVFPSWFQPQFPNAPQFDFQKQITAPLQLLPGGYISTYRLSGGQGWTQLTARKGNMQARGQVGSRRERRRTPRADWVKSTA
jgi:hypothetical protein